MPRDWLFEKYVTERLGCPEIGLLVGRDPTDVYHWLKKYGIPTRSRGSDVRQQFKPGVAMRSGHKHTAETKRKVGAASMARGAVPYKRNGKHWLKGTRGAINPHWMGGITPERQTFYRSPEWKQAVKTVWQRDNATCQRCGLKHKTVERLKVLFHIHHIVSFAIVELRCEPSNLVLLCSDCHHWVHSRQNTAGNFLAGIERQVLAPTLFDLAPFPIDVRTGTAG